MKGTEIQARDAASVGLSLVVPAFNEEALLEATVRSLRQACDGLQVGGEVIIVDDGSRDRTGAIADRLAGALSGVTALHQENRGLGGAFRAGAARAEGTYLMLWPADMPASAAYLAPFARQFGAADVIVGCRRRRVGYNLLMRANAWIYPRLVAALFNLDLPDVNWISAYRRDRFARIGLTQQGIPLLVEALVRLRDAGATFVQVEVEMKPRLGGVPSASRLPVMWGTLTGLLTFWRTWRRESRPKSGF
jgi:glycosyltransferase involved in cell wall biosynthesis